MIYTQFQSWFSPTNHYVLQAQLSGMFREESTTVYP